MNRRIFSVLIILFLAFSSLSACVVHTQPPPRRVEVRPARPFPKAVWIEGHWEHRQREWVWVSGYWVKKPRPKAHWVPGHLKKGRWGWKWVPGHWR